MDLITTTYSLRDVVLYHLVIGVVHLCEKMIQIYFYSFCTERHTFQSLPGLFICIKLYTKKHFKSIKEKGKDSSLSILDVLEDEKTRT